MAMVMSDWTRSQNLYVCACVRVCMWCVRACACMCVHVSHFFRYKYRALGSKKFFTEGWPVLSQPPHQAAHIVGGGAGCPACPARLGQSGGEEGPPSKEMELKMNNLMSVVGEATNMAQEAYRGALKKTSQIQGTTDLWKNNNKGLARELLWHQGQLQEEKARRRELAAEVDRLREERASCVRTVVEVRPLGRRQWKR